MKVVDYYDDLFDINNLPTTDQPYLDILFVEVWSNVTDATDYVCRITLNGDMPTETPDSQLFYEWDIYIDADENSATGEPGPLVTNDLGSDYVVRFCVLDNICYSEVRNLITGYSEKLENNVTNNEILLRWPKSFFPTDSFYFVVTAKKYGERGQGNTFILGDEAPNLGHAVFPPI